jgi:hypothetical protein
MKNALLFSIIISTIFNSCKKGELDPTISLRSRINRISSDWSISKYEKITTNESSLNGNDSQWDETLIVNGNVVTLENNYDGNIEFMEGVKTIGSFLIKKNYTWQRNMQYEFVSDDFKIQYNFEESGTWSFLNKNDTYKNKERVHFVVLNEKTVTNQFNYVDNTTSTEETNYDYKLGQKNEVYQLQMLKKDEIRMDLEQGSSFISNQNTAIYTGNSLGTVHYTLTTN